MQWAEAIGMMPWNYTNTGRNFCRIMERVGSAHLRCKWGPADSYNSGEHDTVGTTYRLLRPYLTSIHLKDAHVLDGAACRFQYVPTGTGDVPYAALFEQFARDRTDAVIAVATHYRVPDAPPETAMRTNIQNTRRLMAQGLAATQGATRSAVR
ncbi:MAG: TIM barrel protein [Chloroflexota bacterium]